MNARLNFFPLGNADTMRIDLADGRKVLIDYAAVHNREESDKRCDLPADLRRDLEQSDRKDFDVVCITHLDSDHCSGFGEFFRLDHDEKYQGDGRIEIWELWVPAAAILEEQLEEDDARLVQAEARYRLLRGSGVRVFSHPERLVEWIEKQYLNIEDREHLIVDAGNIVPGFSLDDPEKAEFFVHSPMAWRQDESEEIDRNEDSIIMQVTFTEGGHQSHLLLASDANCQTLTKIVQATKKNENEDRLLWDIMKLPHHCSYKSLGLERGDDETEPVECVKELFESKRTGSGIIVSTSKPIPAKGSDEDGDQPPHRQAAKYYCRISEEYGGKFVVTMEQPDKEKPVPFTLVVTDVGIEPVGDGPNISTAGGAAEDLFETATMPAVATTERIFPDAPATPYKPRGFA